MRSNHLLGRVAEEPFCSRVPACHDAVQVVAENRVHGSLDDLREEADAGLGLLLAAHVARYARRADDCTPGVDDGRNRQRDVDSGPVLAHSDRLELADPLPRTEPVENVGDLSRSIRREQHRHRLADRLGSRVPVNSRGRVVPGQDRPVEGLAEDRVLRRSDDRLELRNSGACSLRERVKKDGGNVRPKRVGADRKPQRVESIVSVSDQPKIVGHLTHDHIPVVARPPRLAPGVRESFDKELSHQGGWLDANDPTARRVQKEDPKALVTIWILEPHDEGSARESLEQSK